MKTYVYVDGFNLYYGAVKDTPYRWLNLQSMCDFLLPGSTIEKIKYFTARITARPNDPSQPTRQQMYLRALRTLPDLEIIYGSFLTFERSMPLAGQPASKQKFVRVVRTEEKGSDVNLATHLLSDGFNGRYETAVLITNDSDLVEPIRIVRNELGLPVGLLNPQKHPSRVLLKHVSFIKQIRKGVLRASQFTEELHDNHGKFRKPSAW
ncbi:MAG: NYN domain-containing protein [Anaerolineales bacterium]